MKLLPEERLLKLLRGKPKGGGPPPPASGLPHPAALGSVASPGVQITIVALPKHSPVAIAVAGFILVLAVEAVIVIVQLVRPLPLVAVAVPAPAASQAETAALPAAPSVSASASRPLFTPPAVSGAAEARRAPPSGAAKELAARLTLLGIIAGTPPQAIIEDSESKKSYFVAQGQQILEGAMLDAVFDTYVVLDLSGEKFELRL